MNRNFLRISSNYLSRLFSNITSLHTVLRTVVLLAISIRYLTNPQISRLAATWVSSLFLFLLYIFLVVLLPKHTRIGSAKYWYWIPVFGDTLAISWFYFLTGSINSEIYLLFYIPILVAADTCKGNNQLLVFLFIAISFSVSTIALYLATANVVITYQTPIHKLTVDDFLLRTLIPRLSIFLMVLFISFMRSRTLTEQNEILTAVSATAAKLPSGESLDSTLNSIMTAAINLLDGDGCKVYLRVPQKRILELVAIRGIPEDFISKGFRMSFDEGMAGEVFSANAGLIVNDYSKYPRRIREFSDIFQAVVEIPLVFGNEPIGVIAVFASKKRRAFTDEDKFTLSRLAPFASNAIHEVQILEETRRQANALLVLNKAGRAMNSKLSLDKSYLEMAQYAWTLSNLYQKTPSTFSCIGMFNSSLQQLEFVATYPQEYLDKLQSQVGVIHLNRHPIGLVGRSIKERELITSDDVNGSTDYIRLDPSTKSQLSVPIFDQGDVIGVISIEHSETGAYPVPLQSNTKILSHQAAAAIRNARLFEGNEKQHLRITSLYKLTAEIDVAGGMQSVATLLLADLSKFFPYNRSTLQLIRNNYRRVVATSNLEKIDTNLIRPLNDDELIRSIVESKDFTYLSPPSSHPKWEMFSTTADIKSWICIPLVFADETIGLITMDFTDEYKMSEDSEVILRIFSGQAAGIIKNALLSEQNRHRLEELTATQEQLDIVLKDFSEKQNLINIALVYGEDIHYAKSKLGYAKYRASAISHNRLGTVSEEIKQASEEIIKNINAYLKTLADTQRKVIETPPNANVDIHKLLDSVVKGKAQTLWNGEVSVKLFMRSKNPTINAPEKQLRQVFYVIIQNGIEAFDKPGGRLTISTEDMIIEKKQFVRVNIEDNGKGIPEKVQKELFKNKLETANSSHSGLGLMWARDFVRTFGGDILYETEIGLGTIMTVLLPRDFSGPLYLQRQKKNTDLNKSS